MESFMRKNIACLVILLIGIVSLQGQSTAVNDFFDKYKEDPSFTVVNISSSMFAAISGMDLENIDQEMKSLLDNITGMKILTKAQGQSYYKEGIQAVKKGKLEELMSFKEDDSEVLIFGKNKDSKTLSEVIMLSMKKDQFVMTQIKGSISLNQLSKLSETFNK